MWQRSLKVSSNVLSKSRRSPFSLATPLYIEAVFVVTLFTALGSYRWFRLVNLLVGILSLLENIGKDSDLKNLLHRYEKHAPYCRPQMPIQNYKYNRFSSQKCIVNYKAGLQSVGKHSSNWKGVKLLTVGTENNDRIESKNRLTDQYSTPESPSFPCPSAGLVGFFKAGPRIPCEDKPTGSSEVRPFLDRNMIILDPFFFLDVAE